MVHKSVICCTKQFMSGKSSVLSFINQFLGMFNTHTDSKGFTGNSNTFRHKHLISIASTVTASQDHCTCSNLFAISKYHTGYSIVFDNKISNVSFIHNLPTVSNDLLTQTCYHGTQLVRTNVGFMFPQNIFRCTCCNESFQNILHYRVINTGCQLTVRESSCTALTKLHIGNRVKRTCLPKAVYICYPLGNRLATL